MFSRYAYTAFTDTGVSIDCSYLWAKPEYPISDSGGKGVSDTQGNLVLGMVAVEPLINLLVNTFVRCT